MKRTTFLAATAATAAPRIALAQTTTLHVAGVFSDLFAEPFYAGPSGAFAKQGFTVEATPMNNAGAVAAAIGGGALELGVGDLISGVNAIIKGFPLLLIAGSGMYAESEQESSMLVVTKDSPIRTPHDMIGKSIGVPTLVGMTTALLRAWLPANGVPLDSVKLVEIPQGAVVPALQSGTLDVGLLAEPFVTMTRPLIRGVGYPNNIAADREPNKQYPVSVWYASKPWIEADTARARRLVQAIYDTARWANAHRDETFAILVRDGHLDASKVHGMLRSPYATTLTPEMVQPVLDIAFEAKIFDHHIDAAGIITKL